MVLLVALLLESKILKLTGKVVSSRSRHDITTKQAWHCSSVLTGNKFSIGFNEVNLKNSLDALPVNQQRERQ